MARCTQHPSARVLRKWRRIVDEWRGSGLSAREFCKSKGLKSHKTLHVWSSKLNKIDADLAKSTEPVFLPVEVIDEPPEMVESPPEPIEVHLSSGDVIVVPQDCDMQKLSQLVAILRKEWQ